jgi:hypothetical protein
MSRVRSKRRETISAADFVDLGHNDKENLSKKSISNIPSERSNSVFTINKNKSSEEKRPYFSAEDEEKLKVAIRQYCKVS